MSDLIGEKYDLKTIRELAHAQCDHSEIAAYFGLWPEQLFMLVKRDFDIDLINYVSLHRQAGKSRLRQSQYITAVIDRDASMQKWLGKQYLGQAERVIVTPTMEPAQIEKPKLKTFEEFCQAASYPLPYAKQIEMVKFALGGTGPRLVLGARGKGKTDYITILGVAYESYCDWFNGVHEFSALIITKSALRNKSIIREIKLALTANGVPLEISNSDVIRVEGLKGKDDSFSVLPLTSAQFRGRHPRLVVMDDPVTPDDVSETARRKAMEVYYEATQLVSNVVVIGQPVHKLDLYQKLRKLVPTFELKHGEIPELDADLDLLRLSGVSDAVIKASHFLEIDESASVSFAKIKSLPKYPGTDSVAFLDPSFLGNDYCALACITGYFDGIAVKGHCWQNAWYNIVDLVVAKLTENGARRLIIECNSLGEEPLIRFREALRHTTIGVGGVYSTDNKQARILNAAAYSELIHLCEDSDDEFKRQVREYDPTSKHDDAPDALATGMQAIGLVKPATKGKR